MSSPSTALSSNLQVLYNQGLLPSNVSSSTLSTASAPQLNKMATASVSLEVVQGLFSTTPYAPNTNNDTVNLSNVAEAALLAADGASNAPSATPETNSVPGSLVNLIG